VINRLTQAPVKT